MGIANQRLTPDQPSYDTPTSSRKARITEQIRTLQISNSSATPPPLLSLTSQDTIPVSSNFIYHYRFRLLIMSQRCLRKGLEKKARTFLSEELPHQSYLSIAWILSHLMERRLKENLHLGLLHSNKAILSTLHLGKRQAKRLFLRFWWGRRLTRKNLQGTYLTM